MSGIKHKLMWVETCEWLSEAQSHFKVSDRIIHDLQWKVQKQNIKLWFNLHRDARKKILLRLHVVEIFLIVCYNLFVHSTDTQFILR